MSETKTYEQGVADERELIARYLDEEDLEETARQIRAGWHRKEHV